MLDHTKKEVLMNKNHKISLARLMDEFHLTAVYLPSEAEKIMISSPELDRPGLAFAGFFDIFDPDRLQVIGRAEHKYLSNLSPEERGRVIDTFLAHSPRAVIITSGLEVYPELVSTAEKYGVPFLLTPERTSYAMANMISWLNVQLAPRVTRHDLIFAMA